MEEKIKELLAMGNGLVFAQNSYNSSDGTFGRLSVEFRTWGAVVGDFITENYGENSAPGKLYTLFNAERVEGNYENEFERQKNILLGALNACKLIKPKNAIVSFAKKELLSNLFNKFHSVAIQLRSRHNNRNTLDVIDEYDVQDLLHSLLKLHFKDIRNEEWTPSYAGGSSRMDFLLKEEEIVIEVKKTRVGLDDKVLGKQLIEDKAKYQTHPNCKRLICFTYDPEGRILNPQGLQNDLNSEDEKFTVEIIIKPDH